MAVRGAPEKRKRSVGSSSGSSTSSGRRVDSSKIWGGLLLEQDGMRVSKAFLHAVASHVCPHFEILSTE
ncbi:hypothetical protein MRX96_054931 [Rhipicephalus microplus]